MGGPRARPLSPLETILCDSLAMLRSSAMRWTRDPADADDLVQEVLLRLLILGPRLDLTRNVPAYLRRTLANLQINHWRRRAAFRHLMEPSDMPAWVGPPAPETPHQAEDPMITVQRIRLGNRIRAALDVLPRPFLEVLIRVDLLGWDYRETAMDLGIPVGTVMSRLFRARRRMRELLADRPAPLEPNGPRVR